MDHHVKDYYQQSPDEAPKGNFHKVIALQESPDIDWETVKNMVPGISKGWYELAHLNMKDRIGFTHDFWLSRLPYRPGLTEFIDHFFDSLDDIGVYLTQKKFDDPFEAHFIYSLKGNSGFFRGAPGIDEKNLSNLQKFFSDFILPNDYLAFLQIHDGFCKTTDCTGLTKSSLMPETYTKFQSVLQKQDRILTGKGKEIDPKTLIPFYESFGMPFYQCFWADWYPENEMGNVYYSGQSNTISAVETGAASNEMMAFPTFTDWLIFYLEKIV